MNQISVSHLKELKSLCSPPKLIIDLAATVVLILTPDAPTDPWKAFKELLTNRPYPKSFLAKVKMSDPRKELISYPKWLRVGKRMNNACVLEEYDIN